VQHETQSTASCKTIMYLMKVCGSGVTDPMLTSCQNKPPSYKMQALCLTYINGLVCKGHNSPLHPHTLLKKQPHLFVQHSVKALQLLHTTNREGLVFHPTTQAEPLLSKTPYQKEQAAQYLCVQHSVKYIV
jgi:hypothetical protein